MIAYRPWRPWGPLQGEGGRVQRHLRGASDAPNPRGARASAPRGATRAFRRRFLRCLVASVVTSAAGAHARKNAQVGGRFFAFMGTVLAIARVALLLSGDGKGSDELIDLRTKVGLASIFFMAVAWWIHRRMKRKAAR